MTRVIIQSLPSSSRDAARLASRLGLPVARDRFRIDFPDGEMRVTVGPAAPTTIIYASLDQPNDKLIALLFAAEALRRDGAERLVLVAPYLCYMRQDAAFHEGEAISQKAVGRLLAGSCRSGDHCRRSSPSHRRYQRCLSGHRGRQSVGNAGNCGCAAQTGIDPATVVVGPDAEVAALGERSCGPARVGSCGCAESAPWRPFSRDRICRTRIACRPPCPAGRRYCLIRRHLDRLRQGACGSRCDRDRCDRYPCAVLRSNSAAR